MANLLMLKAPKVQPSVANTELYLLFHWPNGLWDSWDISYALKKRKTNRYTLILLSCSATTFNSLIYSPRPQNEFAHYCRWEWNRSRVQWSTWISRSTSLGLLNKTIVAIIIEHSEIFIGRKKKVHRHLTKYLISYWLKLVWRRPYAMV